MILLDLLAYYNVNSGTYLEMKSENKYSNVVSDANDSLTAKLGGKNG